VEYYYVKLVRMKIGVLTMEPADEEARLFSTMCLAEKWLTDNGFIYGQRRFFNYTSGGKEWFHKDDMSIEYVDVVISAHERHSDGSCTTRYYDAKRCKRCAALKDVEYTSELTYKKCPH